MVRPKSVNNTAELKWTEVNNSSSKTNNSLSRNYCRDRYGKYDQRRRSYFNQYNKSSAPFRWHRNNYYSKHRKPPPEKSPPPPPPIGSEEYMIQKVRKTSEKIMEALMKPNTAENKNCKESEVIGSSKEDKICFPVRNYFPVEEANAFHFNNDEMSNTLLNRIDDIPKSNIPNCERKNEPTNNHKNINIMEIQEKIVNHLSKLNDNRKKNLINSTSSDYDDAIQRIQKQKRLDLSRALRGVCIQETQEASNNYINSIIPDIGLELSNLPVEVIEELRKTLDLEQCDFSNDDTSNAYNCESFVELPIDNDSSENYVSIKTVSNLVDNVSSNDSQQCIKSEPEERVQINNSTNVNVNDDIHEISNLGVNQMHSEEYNNNSNLTTVSGEIENSANIDINNDSTELSNLEIDLKIEPMDSEEYDKNVDLVKIDHNTINEEIGNSANIDVKNDSIDTSNSEINFNVASIESEENRNFDNTINKQIDHSANVDINNESTETSNLEIKFKMEPMDSEEYNKDVDNTNTINEQINNSFNADINNDSEISNLKINFEMDTQEYNANLDFDQSDDNIIALNNRTNCETDSGFHDRQCNSSENFTESTVQTESQTLEQLIDYYLETVTKESTFTESVDAMFEIDNAIARLTEFRKSLFRKYATNFNAKKDVLSRIEINTESSLSAKDVQVESDMVQMTSNKKEYAGRNLKFENIDEKILVVKVIDNVLVAASEQGKLFFFDPNNGQVLHKVEVTNLPITAIDSFKKSNTTILCVSSFDAPLKLYDLKNYDLIKSERLDRVVKVQCMDVQWHYIFIGCFDGTILRYSIDKEKFEFDERMNESNIFSLKATLEGCRKVLIIGSRHSPVCVRDALSGLHMRSMGDLVIPTVYCLLLKQSFVYCGTTNHNILVYCFHDGKLENTLKSTSLVGGISCLNILNNLLFAGCHNGNILIFNTANNELIDKMEGPGGVILSMEIYNDQLIIGTMSCKFQSLQIPQQILECQTC